MQKEFTEEFLDGLMSIAKECDEANTDNAEIQIPVDEEYTLVVEFCFSVVKNDEVE